MSGTRRKPWFYFNLWAGRKPRLKLIWWSYFLARVQSNLGLHWLCFTSLCDWSKKNFRRFVDQSDAKQKPVTTWSPAFSRALGSLVVSTLSFHWLLRGSFLLIGCGDLYSFDFVTFYRKRFQSTNRLTTRFTMSRSMCCPVISSDWRIVRFISFNSLMTWLLDCDALKKKEILRHFS